MTLTAKTQELLKGWQLAGRGVYEVLSKKGTVTWQQARDTYVEELAALLPAPDGVAFETVNMDGVPAMLVTPETVIEDRVLFYMHGGGYVHGGVNAYRGLTGHYAKRLGARVYVPDYRQAPEFIFPTPIDDVFRAYKALFSLGHEPSSIALSGDSAGGALVVTIMRKARDAGVPLPVGGVAISPWADLTHSGASAKTRNDLDPVASVDILTPLARTFLGNTLATDPDVSPIFADLRGLSPRLILMGENEVMLSGGITLAERLAEQRVRTTLEVWPGMFHVWLLFAGFMPEADEALDSAVDFLIREYRRARASLNVSDVMVERRFEPR